MSPSARTSDLATHPQLFGSTSVVIPCHNEETNVRGAGRRRSSSAYDAYIHEIIIVDDNSTDRTADVVRANWLPRTRASG